MNRLLSFSFVFLFICSCTGDSDESENLTSDTGKVMKSEFLDTCKCAALDVDSLGNHFRDGEKFTGICMDYYPGSTDKYIEKNLLSGRIHGKVTYYSKDGEMLIEEIYENGQKKRSGEVDVLNCPCTELKKEETHIPQVPFRYLLDGIPYTGTCEEFYPESNQLYVSRQYKNGVMDGHTVFYNRDGSTLMIEKYESGLLISVVN